MKLFILKILLLLFVNVSLAQVSADFTVSSTNGCAPFVVNFLDISSGGANNWIWNFGNGNTSTDQNPAFVYSQPGFYTVTLTASDGDISDMETKSALIRVNASPTPNFSVDNDKGCSPHLANFTDLSIPQSGTITQWYWAFGNGEVSTLQNPITTFGEIKKYNVYLKVTDVNGCKSTITKNSFIELDGPKADFEYDSVICGLPAKVLFLNKSKGSSLNYYWEFGDGKTSKSEVPGVHTYNSFDSTEVLLAVTEKATGCTDTIKRSLVVGNYEATFDYNIICGDDEFTIEVENTTPFFTKLEWDFNRESFKNTKNASFHFNSGGVKNIILKSTIDESCFDTTLLKYTLPNPTFTYDAPKCSDPFQVTFINNSQGDEMTYLWDFQDSTFSTDVDPYHEFDVPPERYLVELYAQDQFGCTDSVISWVRVPFPIARFYEKDSIYTGCSPLNLTFLDTSYTLSSTIASVKWDFGDPSSGSSNTSTRLSPSHNYTAPGDYDITYIIYTDDGCADTAIYKSAIKAGEKPSSADFEQLLNDTICYGNSIEFIEETTYPTNTVESNYYCWSFYEDNSPILIDIEKSPKYCPNSIEPHASNRDFVNYSNPSHKYLDFETGSVMIGDTFFTTDAAPNAGALFTHLVVGYNNCFTEIIKSNFIDTTIAVIGIATKDSIIMFSDSTKTFGFFNASLNYDSVAYAYGRDLLSSDTLFRITNDTNYIELQEGHIYNVYTKIVNKTSICENLISDQIVIDSVRMEFDMANKQCYSDNPVLFDDNSFSKYGKMTKRSWLVDGEVVAISNFNDSTYYNFPDTGVFNVSLEIEFRLTYTQNGIKSIGYYTRSKSQQIKIEGLKAKGFSDTLKVCGGDTIFFIDSSNSTTALKDYRWRFGYETDSSTLQNPFHIYKDAGAFTPTLYVTDIFGCYDSISLPVITVNRPFIDFEISDSLICKYDVVALTNKSEGKNLSFKWTIDTIIQFSPDIEHKFDSVGDFDVKLFAIDLFGCVDSLIKPNEIKVEDFPETNFVGDPLYIDCPPLASIFKDSTLTPVIKWNWDFGDGATSENQDPAHIYTTPGFYDVQLITTNYSGCSDTLKRLSFVEIDGPNGSVNFDPDTLCIPEEVVFKHELQNTVYFIWKYGDGNTQHYNYTNNPDSTKHTFLFGGQFQPNIELIDGAGCLYTLPQLPVIKGDDISANFETSDSVICDLSNIPFTNKSSQTFNSTYFWKFGNGDTSITKSPIYSYQADSVYRVTLIQNSPLGCVDSISKSIKVFNAPFTILSMTNNNFCIPSISDVKVDFDNANFVSDSVYFFIDGNHFNGDSLQTTISTEGNHDIRYIIEYGAGACLIDSLTKVPFYKWPIASFEYTPSNNSVEEPIIFFNNTSQNSSSWLWDFDNSNQSTKKSPGHNFNNKGVYNIALISESLGGCADTTTTTIKVAPYNFVKLPSAFSPNGDGKNETFGILRAGELEVQEFKIYNRWGNIVFETNNKNETWDGKRKGKEQNIGTYIYYIKGNNRDGEVIEIKGNFTLLR